jgi:hypothetical protein
VKGKPFHQPSLARPANSVPRGHGVRGAARGLERELKSPGAIQEKNRELRLARTADPKKREMHLERLNTREKESRCGNPSIDDELL